MNGSEISWEHFLLLKSQQPLYRFTVVTPSMAPLIEVGSLVTVDTQKIPQRGDIIVFWSDGKLICHLLWHFNKVIREQGMQVLGTRGLRAEYWDATICENQVLGVVVSHRLSFWWKSRLLWRDFRTAIKRR